MRFNPRFSSRGWGTVVLGVAATAIAIANPSREGIQTALGCSGASNEGEDWEIVESSDATETWSRDGFHYWMGVPSGWSESLPESLDDLPNTRLEVTDDDGEPIAGQLGLYKIRRRAVALTWRADAELPVGSTLHSSLALYDGDPYPKVQVLTVADSTRALELPVVHTEGWRTETWTEGADASCYTENQCGVDLHVDEVSALTWRLGWTVPTSAPWSFELVMTQGRALQAVGPDWVGHRPWASGGVGLHLAPAQEYCFKVVGTDFSTGTTLSSEEMCSPPGPAEEDVFLDESDLFSCVSPPHDESLRERWCEHNPAHEECGGSTGGSAGTSGSTNTGGSAGTPGSTDTGGSAGAPGSSNTGGSAGTSGSGGSEQPAASGGGAGVPGADDDADRLSKGGCWCSVPQATASGHSALAFVGVVLLGLRRRRAS